MSHFMTRLTSKPMMPARYQPWILYDPMPENWVSYSNRLTAKEACTPRRMIRTLLPFLPDLTASRWYCCRLLHRDATPIYGLH